MIQINKTKDKIILTLISELDREDVYDLVSDLQKWLDETVELPKFKGISEEKVKDAWEYSKSIPSGYGLDTTGWSKEKKEAYEQACSKRKLEEDLKRYFVDILDSQYIEKMAKVYELDPKTKEVITKEVKIKPLTKKNEKRK